eukprot:1919672-Rhodomonas_salina.1
MRKRLVSGGTCSRGVAGLVAAYPPHHVCTGRERGRETERQKQRERERQRQRQRDRDRTRDRDRDRDHDRDRDRDHDRDRDKDRVVDSPGQPKLDVTKAYSIDLSSIKRYLQVPNMSPRYQNKYKLRGADRMQAARNRREMAGG